MLVARSSLFGSPGLKLVQVRTEEMSKIMKREVVGWPAYYDDWGRLWPLPTGDVTVDEEPYYG